MILAPYLTLFKTDPKKAANDFSYMLWKYNDEQPQARADLEELTDEQKAEKLALLEKVLEQELDLLVKSKMFLNVFHTYYLGVDFKEHLMLANAVFKEKTIQLYEKYTAISPPEAQKALIHEEKGSMRLRYDLLPSLQNTSVDIKYFALSVYCFQTTKVKIICDILSSHLTSFFSKPAETLQNTPLELKIKIKKHLNVLESFVLDKQYYVTRDLFNNSEWSLFLHLADAVNSSGAFHTFLEKSSLMIKNNPELLIMGLHLAERRSNTKLAIRCVELWKNASLPMDNFPYKLMLEFSLEQDSLDLFKALLQFPYHFTKENLNAAKGNIKNFLDYKPGKNYVTIQQICIDSPHLLLMRNTLGKLIRDFTDTTDEESSDEESDKPIILADNKTIATKTLLFHGAEFLPMRSRVVSRHHNSRKKQIENYSTQDFVSEAVLERALNANPIEPNITVADNLVKGYIAQLKVTRDQRAKDKYNNLERKLVGEPFNSLYMHFLQLYVNSFGKAIEGLQRNFNSPSPDNPFISTIPRAEVALAFMNGTNLELRTPRYRHSTGELKHRRLGFMQVFAIEPEYLAQYSQTVGHAPVNINTRRHTDEVIVFSSIPKKYIVAQQTFSLPDFRKPWSEEVRNTYGLNEGRFLYYKTAVNNACFNDNTPEEQYKLNREITTCFIEVTKWQLVKFQSALLERKIKFREQEAVAALERTMANLGINTNANSGVRFS